MVAALRQTNLYNKGDLCLPGLVVRIECVNLLTVYVNEMQFLDPFVPNRPLQQLTLNVKNELKLALLRQICLHHADTALTPSRRRKGGLQGRS